MRRCPQGHILQIGDTEKLFDDVHPPDGKPLYTLFCHSGTCTYVHPYRFSKELQARLYLHGATMFEAVVLEHFESKDAQEEYERKKLENNTK